MLNEKTLLDSWVATGKTYEDFKTLLTELSDCLPWDFYQND